MPLNINPMWVQGCWVLDYHTISSVHRGTDEYGNPQFDTQRTEIGELLYMLKFRPLEADDNMVTAMAGTIADFIRRRPSHIDIIVPVPHSETRPRLHDLLEYLSEQLDVPVSFDSITRTRDVPAIKNVQDYDERVRLLQDAHRINPTRIAGRRVLLFDDVYRSGATMSTVARALYLEGNAKGVYRFAITRTRSNR